MSGAGIEYSVFQGCLNPYSTGRYSMSVIEEPEKPEKPKKS